MAALHLEQETTTDDRDCIYKLYIRQDIPQRKRKKTR